MFARSLPIFPLIFSTSRLRPKITPLISLRSTSLRSISSAQISRKLIFIPLSSVPSSIQSSPNIISRSQLISFATMTSGNQKLPIVQEQLFGLNDTSGNQLPVWVVTEPFEKRPLFQQLQNDITTDICIVGGGIAGISTAYELVRAGKQVTLIEARELLSGESGRTSGHLSSDLDDGFVELVKTFGEQGARQAWNSHEYAIKRIGEIAEAEGIDCEYRIVRSRTIVDVPKDHPDYHKLNDLQDEYEVSKRLGIECNYIKDGAFGTYKGAILEYPNQGLFHPTKYLNGVLRALQKSPLFKCYVQTRMDSYKNNGSGKGVDIKTEGGHTIRANNLVMTTNVPLQEIEIIGKESYYRTYCVAHRVPKGVYPDESVYTNSDPYIYVRKTASPDPSFEYLIIGGEDHKVGFKSSDEYENHFDRLSKWALQHYPDMDPVAEYKWSGQVVEPNDYLAYIGLNTGVGIRNVYVATGDSGHGLTHGVIASRIITDLITEGNSRLQNPWAGLYSPSRKPKPRTIPEVVRENVQQQSGYLRYIKTDVSDIESIPPCSGAVMHAGLSKLKKPLAVYKDGEGNVTTFSAICPHLKGVVAWNAAEKTWDCPIHGSRFDGRSGKCVMGPAIHGLNPEDKAAEHVVQVEGKSG